MGHSEVSSTTLFWSAPLSYTTSLTMALLRIRTAIMLFYTPSAKDIKSIFESYAGDLSLTEKQKLTTSLKSQKYSDIVLGTLMKPIKSYKYVIINMSNADEVRGRALRTRRITAGSSRAVTMRYTRESPRVFCCSSRLKP